MFRSFLYKLAVVLAVLSLVPLLIFFSRKESPPEKVKVKLHNRQTVENFTLESTGKEKWLLSSPLALFKGKDVIELKSPVLTLISPKRAVVRANEAVYYRGKGLLKLKGVSLNLENLKAFSVSGTYFLKKELFKGKGGCEVLTENSETTGNLCTLYLKSEEVIISDRIKSVIRSERR
ncbi:LPS export ABC transporter periplasmic protein LptC [Thermovibrio sp.]